MTRRIVPRSGLPNARTAVRRAAGINRPSRRRQPVQDDDSTTSGAPIGSPYDDPSRDLGDGPDELSPIQRKMLLVGVLLAIYLGFATCGPREEPPELEHRCHICTEFQQEFK